MKEAPASATATANITGYLTQDEAVAKKKEAKPKEKKAKKVEKLKEVNSSSGSNSTSPPESSQSVMGHTDSSLESLTDKQQKRADKRKRKQMEKLMKMLTFTEEEAEKSVMLVPLPENMTKIGDWAQNGMVKFRVHNNAIQVHVHKKAEGYRAKKKELYRMQ